MSDATGTRSRTVTWQDPALTARAAPTLSGLDFLRAILEGRLPPPPIAQVLGFSLAEVEEGRVVFTVEPGEHHYHPMGLVHGGLLATVLDSAMACAVHTKVEAGTVETTIELHVHYVRPVSRESGLLRAEGRLLHLGGRLATAQGRVLDATGRLVAHGTTSCLLVPA